MPSINVDSQSAEVTSTADPESDETTVPTASADLVVGEEPGHPLGVGIGAVAAGAAGAAMGAVLGPLGIVAGAAVGALVGGLAGGEIAQAGENTTAENPDASYTLPALDGARSFPADPAPSVSGPSSGSLTRPLATSTEEGAAAEFDGTLSQNLTDEGPFAREKAVQMRAYQRYLERQSSGIPGDEADDWAYAENETRGVAES